MKTKKIKLKKTKAKTLPQLKAQAWKLFSEVRRRQEADENGVVRCVSCGERMHWKKSQAGHFIPKVKGLVYWFEGTNVHPQCVKCNMFQTDYAKVRYTLYMIDRYGRAEVERLLKLEKIDYNRAAYNALILILKKMVQRSKNSLQIPQHVHTTQ